jgi:hypothetical protein
MNTFTQHLRNSLDTYCSTKKLPIQGIETNGTSIKYILFRVTHIYDVIKRKGVNTTIITLRTHLLLVSF